MVTVYSNVVNSNVVNSIVPLTNVSLTDTSVTNEMFEQEIPLINVPGYSNVTAENLTQYSKLSQEAKDYQLCMPKFIMSYFYRNSSFNPCIHAAVRT
jgi:hypothetical protein